MEMLWNSMKFDFVWILPSYRCSSLSAYNTILQSFKEGTLLIKQFSKSVNTHNDTIKDSKEFILSTAFLISSMSWKAYKNFMVLEEYMSTWIFKKLLKDQLNVWNTHSQNKRLKIHAYTIHGSDTEVYSIGRFAQEVSMRLYN